MVVMVTPKKNPWGARLQKLRESKDLTQVKAAKLLGVPLTTLRNWEQGRAAPAPITRRAVEEAIRAYHG